MKKTLIPALLVLIGGLAAPTFTQAADLNVFQYDKSNLTFVYKQMNVPVEGRFKKFSAQLSFDPGKPEKARIDLDIDLAGIDAGSPEANDEISGKVWFNTKNFPQAKFVSSSFKSLGGRS